MHAYVYIDANNDSIFTCPSDFTDLSATELYSYCYYKGYNSLGESAADNPGSTLTLPKFYAPAEADTYRIRFKLDWDNVDPGGAIAADGTCTGDNGILKNVGGIIDMNLKVTNSDATGINAATVNPGKAATIYTLDGRRVGSLTRAAKGVYIVNGQKTLVK